MNAGAVAAQNAVNLGAGLTYTAPHNWELKADYNYEAKQDFDAHSALIKAGYRF